jgi:hypothetical protein
MIQQTCNVVRIGRPLILGLMTRIAIGEHQTVVVVHVALYTLRRSMRPCQGKFGRVVIERRRSPCRGSMTFRAGL